LLDAGANSIRDLKWAILHYKGAIESRLIQNGANELAARAEIAQEQNDNTIPSETIQDEYYPK